MRGGLWAWYFSTQDLFFMHIQYNASLSTVYLCCRLIRQKWSLCNTPVACCWAPQTTVVTRPSARTVWTNREHVYSNCAHNGSLAGKHAQGFKSRNLLKVYPFAVADVIPVNRRTTQKNTRICFVPLTEVLGGGPSIRRFHGGSPWLAKSLILR